MKINGLQVAEHGSGYQVTLSLRVGAEENLAGAISSFTGELQLDLSEVWASVEADAGLGSREPHLDREAEEDDDGDASVDADDDDAGVDAGAEEGGTADEGTGRRRRRRASGDAVGGEDTGRRRRRAAPQLPADGDGDAKPASGTSRRRRLAKPSAEVAAEDGGEVAGNPTRRRGGSISTTKSPSKVSDKDLVIGDADLLKACSQAASKAGASEVMELLDEFGCTKVNQLRTDQRSEFFDRVKALK